MRVPESAPGSLALTWLEAGNCLRLLVGRGSSEGTCCAQTH